MLNSRLNYFRRIFWPMVIVDAIIWFIEEHKRRLIVGHSRHIQSYLKKCENLKTAQDVSIFLKLNRIPRLSQRAQISLLKWINADWPIILSSKIPSPGEMLAVQAQGKRVVSWLPGIKGPILDKEDNWEFMLHDLMHAERFFYSPSLYRQQVGFFRWLKEQSLEISGAQWDYLRSDMNTHPLHALQFLKHLLACNGIFPKFNIPHWEIINSPDYPVLPLGYYEEIGVYFQNF
jgi:hypothetical protein